MMRCNMHLALQEETCAVERMCECWQLILQPNYAQILPIQVTEL